MKQRRPTRRKASTELPPRSSNAVLEPVGTPVGPLTLREPTDQAAFKGEGGLRADAAVVRAAQHEEMLSWIAALDRLLAELPKHKKSIAELPKLPIGIGHNRPPITNEDVKEIRQAVAVLKAQPVMPTAPDEVRAAGLTLMRFGESLGKYLLKQADVFVSEAVKSGGIEFGKRLIQSPFWWALATALMLAANSVASWLH